ncbi:MFS transporter small subunit [Phaeodactylibacter xiamenensis]
MEKNQKGLTPQVAMAWLFVGLPLIWGVSQTIIKSFALFN